MSRDLRTVIATWNGDTMAVMNNHFINQELHTHRHDRPYCRFLKRWKRLEPDEFCSAPLIPVVSRTTVQVIQSEWRNQLQRRQEQPRRLTAAQRAENERRLTQACAAVHAPVCVPGTDLQLKPPRSMCLEGYEPSLEELDDSDSEWEAP